MEKETIQLPQPVQQTLQTLEQLGDEFAVESFPEWSEKAATKGAKKVKLWQVPRSTGELLYTLVRTQKPRTILELGTSAGYSALWLGTAASDYGGHVYTIDSSSMKVEMAREYIRQAGLQENISVVHSPIADLLSAPEEWPWQPPVDMLFLDADKKNYLRFFQLLEPHISDNAIVVADDAIKIRHAMADFLEYMENHTQFTTRIEPMDHGIFIGRKR